MFSGKLFADMIILLIKKTEVIILMQRSISPDLMLMCHRTFL